MPLSFEEHLDDLVRHIDRVRDNCLLLGRRLIKRGEKKFGLAVIKRGFVHDSSKFSGIEWEYMHSGKDAPKEQLMLAVSHHQKTNDHHPEFWDGGFEKMSREAIAEMACDVAARSEQFKTSLRDWITNEAVERYKINLEGDKFREFLGFIDLLTEDNFVR